MILMSISRKDFVLVTVAHTHSNVYSRQSCFPVDIPDPANVRNLSCLMNSISHLGPCHMRQCLRCMYLTGNVEQPCPINVRGSEKRRFQRRSSWIVDLLSKVHRFRNWYKPREAPSSQRLRYSSTADHQRRTTRACQGTNTRSFPPRNRVSRQGKPRW